LAYDSVNYFLYNNSKTSIFVLVLYNISMPVVVIVADLYTQYVVYVKFIDTIY